MRPTWLLGAFVAILALGCDAPTAESTDPGVAAAPATLAQLVGPWNPVPYVASPELLAAMSRECRSDIPPPVGVELAVVDVRGGGIAQVYLAGPHGAASSCNDMKIGPNGTVAAAGGGSTTNGGEDPPPLGQFEIRLNDISGSGRPVVTSAVAGPIGAGIARVQIVGPGSPVIEATVSNGWFAAWTPGAWPPGWRVVGLDATGAQVTSLQGP